MHGGNGCVFCNTYSSLNNKRWRSENFDEGYMLSGVADTTLKGWVLEFEFAKIDRQSRYLKEAIPFRANATALRWLW